MNSDTRTELIKKRGYRQDIAGDALTLYLSNNPKAAQWLAERIGDEDKVLLELCCAVGVTLEYVAPKFKQAIGVDIDEAILDFCQQNLEKAHLSEKVSLILGDVRDSTLLKSLQADTIIYDIPYWYPEKYKTYSSQEEEWGNPDLGELITNIRRYISKDIVIFAPREMGYNFFNNALGDCECSQVFINGQHDRNYIFLGDLVATPGTNLAKL